MEQQEKLKTTDLIPDNLNANQGTEEGAILIQNSITELGAGRSVLLDKNNKLIAGNKATEAAIKAGIVDVIIVETDGSQLVAVRRNDIDLDSSKGRQLALADNSTSETNLNWNQEVLAEIKDKWGIDPEKWNIVPIEQFEGNIDDFFVQADEKEKQPKTIKCPHCGQFVEI